MIDVKVKLWHPDARAPSFTLAADACADVHVFDEEDAITIWPGESRVVYTGFSLEIQHGYEGVLRGRSGLATKGLIVHTGTVDHEFRGRVGVVVHCIGKHYHTIRRHERIAQLAIRAVPSVRYSVVDELSESERGAGGFGHTGAA